MAANNNISGVLWMGGAVLSFSAMALGVRELLARMGPFEVLFWRSAVMLLIVLALLGACDREGPAERAGEKIDRAAEDVRDAVKGK